MKPIVVTHDELWYYETYGRCSWGVGLDPASGCDEPANDYDGMCGHHRRVYNHLLTSPLGLIDD